MWWCILFSIILATDNYVASQSACVELDTCDRCIGYALEKCAWCPSKDLKGKRCQMASFALENKTWCSDKIENPINEVELIENVELSISTHLTPQKIKLKARPGVFSEFKIKYQLGRDYPLDVYFLIDYSSTMMFYRNKYIRKNIDTFKQNILELSNNIQVGYGSFLEKPALPFVDKTDVETVSYAFKNNAPLSNDFKNFGIHMAIMYQGKDRERPNSSLEALMQAIVCGNKIGWRKEALRIIVLLTDAVPHKAGDGRVLGAFKPHDMKCHIDPDGTYNTTASITLDYPSLSQINKASKEQNTQIIFVVEKNVLFDFQEISKKIKLSTYFDLSSITSLSEVLKKSYKEMLHYPKLDVKVPPDVEHKLDPPCMVQHNSELCEIKDTESKEIKVSVKLTKCPETKTPLAIELRVIGLNEKLLVEVEPLCQCACQNKFETDSKECSSSGTFVCGVCNCNENRSGERCECDGNTDHDDEKCINPIDENVCSHRGDCRCGKCENCRDNSQGEFCQFTDSDCFWPDGKVCAGHGRCLYGRCQCDLGWKNDDCACIDDDRVCIEPYTQKVCSGNGDCVCGKCKCYDTYGGEFCDDCINCAETKCKNLEKYVNCVYNTHKEVGCTDKDIIFSIINKTAMIDEQYSEYASCSLQRDDGARIIFKHKIITNKLYVIIQSDLELPPKAKIWVPISITIAVTLLVGLITVLARKLLVDMHDRRAYAEFEKQLTDLGLDDCTVGEMNDNYIPPIQEYVNPAYGK